MLIWADNETLIILSTTVDEAMWHLSKIYYSDITTHKLGWF